MWLAEARTDISGLREVDELAAFLTARRVEVIEKAAAVPGQARTRMLSDLIDVVVRRMLEVACDPEGSSPSLLSRAERSLTIVATGGYGRRELAPFSDVDISFIAASEDDPEIDAITRRMFRLIMDVFLAEAKLKVGYAYRLVGEAGTLHHQNQTALLDARYVAGSREVYQAFQDELRRNIQPVAFIHDKLKEREASVHRHGTSLYRVEPNIKEGEGSLRDLHLASWLAQVAWGFSRRTVWDDIRRHGLLTTAEVSRAFGVQEFFSRLRWEMHLVAGQQADSLTVQKQESTASTLGYADTEEESGAERLMRDYYAHAEVARRTAEKIIRRAGERRLQLEPGLDALGGKVVLQNPEVFENDPVACLRAFAYCQRYGLALDQPVIDAIRLATERCPAPVGDEEAARLFVMMLRSDNVAGTLTDMASCGVLQWYIEEFGTTMRLVPFDAAHEFTIGWHSLVVVQQCERLGKSGDEDMRRLFSSLRQPELLYVLALLHDCGKAIRGRDHTESGAEIASAVARRLGFDSEAADRLQFLVRNHQLMSDTARLRDLNLRKTVEDFAAVVDDVDTLTMLYVFTNADILAVGSAAWSEIQGRFLRELYYRAERAIITKTPLIDSEEDMALYRSRVRRELSITALPQEAVEEHVSLMPAIYLLNTGPEEMASHIEAIGKARAGEPSAEFRSEPGSDFTELTICALDDPRPGLLSKIAGALWALDVNVHAAQVFTREGADKVALDLLYVDFESKQLPEFKKAQVEREVAAVLKGERTVESLLEEKGKTLPPNYESLSLEVLDHVSEQHSVIEVHAHDLPGLLYRFTRAIASLGWDIHSARVSTWGDEARDAFYVTVGGSKLGAVAAAKLEEALRTA